MRNITIVIMGGGTAGWVSALYLLKKSSVNNLNLKIKLVASEDIGTIGVGEGTTPLFTEFIENICNISREEFLKETKGSVKFGIKFSNWNFDDENYYHPFSLDNQYTNLQKEDYYNRFEFIQFAINELNYSQEDLQRKLLGFQYDLLEENKVSFDIIPTNYAYHFDASLLIKFLRKKCLEYKNFSEVEGIISKVNYNEHNYIKSISIKESKTINGDFFINCLGFKSDSILDREYFNFKYYDEFILNNSAFAIQVKNTKEDVIEPYTTSTADEYGWTWKIPQYEKTGYGYVYSDQFINDEDKIYDSLIKTYNIKEENIFKTRKVKSKAYYNKKQLHKNCLTLGLASGFVEPLEATSIHMTIISLNSFFGLLICGKHSCEISIRIFNSRLSLFWESVFKFIVFHYFTNNPINNYWKHYLEIKEKNIFDFYERYKDDDNTVVFSKFNYYLISLGMKMKDQKYSFQKEIYLRNNVESYFSIYEKLHSDNLPTMNKILNNVNIFDKVFYT